MNALYDPSHKLPREIVARVFECEYALETYEEPSKSPFVLGAVCRFWRAIAWSTPAIWTHVSFCMNPPNLEDDLASRLELLGPYLNRSGALPLSIRVYVNGQFQFIQDDEDIEHLLEILYGCVHRWHTLDLKLPVAFLPSFKNQSLLFGPSTLKSLSLSIIEEVRTQVDLDLTQMSDNLQRLCLNSTALTLDSVRVRHAHLTHVTAMGSVDSCMNLFTSSPLLEEADLFEENEDYTASNFGPAHFIKHESLKSLKVTFTYQSPHLGTILQYAAFPNLHTLLLDSIGHCSEALLPFLGHVRALKVLELWNLVHWSAAELRALFPKLPRLEELAIHETHGLLATEVFNAIFQQPGESSEPDTRVAPQLPNLITFHYSGKWESNDHWSFLCHLGNHHYATRASTSLCSPSELLPALTQTWPNLRRISADVLISSATKMIRAEAFLDQEHLEVAQRLRAEGIEISLSFVGVGVDTSDLVEDSAKELESIRLQVAGDEIFTKP